MRNKKGFTLIELIVSVVLVSVVLVALIGSLLQLRSAYSVVHENSDVIVYTSSISRVINSDINANSGIKFISCETDGKKCSLILGNDERRELIITENDKILDDAEEGITHTNNKTTLKYMDTTRYDKTNNEADKILLYIRTLELDKYSNDNAQVTTSSGYNFYDMSANQYEYFDERGRYLDAFTTLTIRLLDGVNLDLSKYNITLYGAGRYDYSKYIGRAFRIDLDNNDADTAGTTTIDEVFGVGFFKAESSHTKKDQIKKITIPTKKVGDDPQVFLGYFYEPYGVNVETQIIDASGNIYADPRTFKNDVILNDSTTGRVYAKWSPTAPGFSFPPGCIANCTPEPEEYTVTLNKDQRGKTCNSVGTNNYVVKYFNMVPPVEIPQCAGYTFEGYLYNDVDLYHNRNGIGEKTYEIVGNATFDAQWHACEQGQYSLMTEQTCSDCAKGSIAATSASGECTPCQNGKTTNGVKSTACSATCPNSNEHVLEWKTAEWDDTTNQVRYECVIKTCKTGYDGALSSNRCVANGYTIKFEMNGGKLNGSTSPSNISATYDVEVTINNPMRAGYAFAGWTYNGTPATALAGGVAWSSTSTKSKATTFKNLTSVSGGTVTMTANWGECVAGTYNDGTTTTCKDCEAGYYCTGGTHHALCTTLATDYTSSATKSPAATSCYIPKANLVGKYVAEAKKNAVQCAANGYCPGDTDIYYNQTGGRKLCTSLATNYTTSAAGSSAATSCYIPKANLVGKYVATAKANAVTCAANGYCPGDTDIYYNQTGGRKLCTSLATDYTTSAEGSSASTNCYIPKANLVGKYVAEARKNAVTCAANGYCPGDTDIYYGSLGGRKACTDLASDYTSSAAGSSVSTSCYIPKANLVGKYVATAKKNAVQCAANGYCPGDTDIYYNQTGGRKLCTSLATDYTSSAAGSSASTRCYIPKANLAGKYVAEVKKNAVQCAANGYCPGDTDIYYNQTGGRKLCTSLATDYTTSAAGSSASTSCYIPKANLVGKYVAEAKKNAVQCAANGYCAGDTNVYYGSTGGRTGCPTSYPGSASGSTVSTQCRKTVNCTKDNADHDECTVSGTYDAPESCSREDCNHTGCTASGTYTEEAEFACTRSTCNYTGCSCWDAGASGTYTTSSTETCTTSTCSQTGCSCTSASASGTYTTSSTENCTSSTCSETGCSCWNAGYSGTYTYSTPYAYCMCDSDMWVESSNCYVSSSGGDAGYCYCRGKSTGQGYPAAEGICMVGSTSGTANCNASTCNYTGCSCWDAGYSGTYTASTSHDCTTSTCNQTGCSCTPASASGTYTTSTSHTCTTSTCSQTGCDCWSAGVSGTYYDDGTYNCTISDAGYYSSCSCSGTYYTPSTCTRTDADHTGCTVTGSYYVYSPS